MPISDYTAPVPAITTAQMIEVDRAMIEDFHVALIQMMENAGRHLAHLARERFLDGDPRAKEVVVLAGTGGNGGGAMVCARWLHNWGADVRVCMTRLTGAMRSVPAHQLDILQRMGIPVADATALPAGQPPHLIVDGIIGYSLQGVPRGAASAMIRWANATPAPVLALDVPSGIDTTTGQVYDPAIMATATLTLALPKIGLQTSAAAPQVGELYLADISVPPNLYARPPLNLQVGPLFATSEIIRLR